MGRRVAISFAGLAFWNGEKWITNRRNWELTKERSKLFLIDDLSKNNTVNTYITTYNENPTLESLMSFYNPKESTLITLGALNQQRSTFLSSLKQLANQDVDFIINTRFDAGFKSPISKWNIDYNKFNFIFREQEPQWTNEHCVGDAFHALPKKYLNAFIKVVEDEMESPTRDVRLNDLHTIYDRMSKEIGQENIHFIFEGTHSSINNIAYELVRAC
jgi:hypothetical protein